VGESGAGKSTFVSLLLRFVEPEDGKIVIDGENIACLRQDDLRRAIAYVPQEPLLFHRSLRENIKYGNSDASEEEMRVAVKRAHATDFIEKLPQGYDTLVGEKGIKLSGGQKQRIMISRAILKKAPILVLDEATSSLDSRSEKLIQSALEELMRNRTTIVIAHRLSTLKQMDRIIVFDNGKIVEDGGHKDLLNKKGKYYELWQHQIS
jgi:ATP-binding cassette subfamily B protein